ncbi:hypothetical protein GFC29_909 [Anoxybacillus sp. B7M1]|jgi:hypothetical protein|uniref:DUF2935 domain-containing protein n=1 Tax=unclassified Anoxybacillus TaxID=2639704 RepID=UPI0005CDBE13|nr:MULTISPECIES: DUF2935 domain-containing protein [unclassified Anoxybacillus]ANB56229.1 hypothetical protein GFC28_717 [Anoxybacillus sp. B2M1]ANB64719.1 hypothetical protein GFC29_909 [Anoxybacillus sp. B7M1]
MSSTLEEKARFEHRFWLQVLGDHARFIYEALAPVEKEDIATAYQFIQAFDRLLGKTDSENWSQLTLAAEAEALRLREFKLHLIRKHLLGQIKIHLSPTFLNHMVNELEEYLRLLSYFKANQMPPVSHELHHHLIWLLDAAGHAGIISSNLDDVEKSLKKKSKKYQKNFEAFYLKAVELTGYLRTNLSSFPALKKMNSDAALEIKLFQQFLQELEELELSAQALGTFTALMADHMFREECYYLMKLAESADLESPHCDPAKPRIEERT